MLLTNLQYILHCLVLIEAQTLVEGELLVVSTSRTFTCDAGVHTDRPLITGEAPVDDSTLDRLRDALISVRKRNGQTRKLTSRMWSTSAVGNLPLLYFSEGDVISYKFCRDIQ